jgi:hypothetical protein
MASARLLFTIPKLVYNAKGNLSTPSYLTLKIRDFIIIVR